MALTMTVWATWLTSMSLLASLIAALASSLPPENQQMDLHMGQLLHKHLFAPHPFEELHNTLVNGGREVDPRFPLAAASPPPSSVKKELGGGGPELSEGKDALLGDQPAQALDQEDLTTPITALLADEQKPFSEYAEVDNELHPVASAIVPRKGVGEMPSSVVARKGAVFNVSDASPEAELVITTSNTEDSIAVTNAPPTITPSYKTTTVSSFIAMAPANDIPIPPVKQVTTERSAPPAPSPSLAYAPSSLSYAPPPPASSPPTKHASRRLKPAVAVDAVNNKAFNSTPVIMGVTFGVLLIVILAIVAYKRLQDVWSRRHYDRMDFLIDGMYDL